MTLYLDGLEVFTSTEFSLDPIPNGGRMVFGQEQDNANVTSDFNPSQITIGQIGDIRIWDGIRTAEQIRQDAFNPIADPTDPTLVANWRPDAATGTIPDVTGGVPLVRQNYQGGDLPEIAPLGTGVGQ